jgi:DNA polymerase III epsilon subunit-like protein
LKPLRVEESAPEALGLDAEVLARLVGAVGPVAVVDLETTGLPDDPEAELLEFGAVLLDPGVPRVMTAHSLARPCPARFGA